MSSQYPHHDDEIDLRKLFKILWQGKLTIIAFTIFFGGAGVIYALNAQQWWTAKAVITTPKVTDLVTFSQTVKRYQPAFDIYQPNGQVLSGEELDELTGQEEIFERFVEAFNANNNKREFFEQSDTFAELLNGFEIQLDDRVSYRLALQDWLGRMTANMSDKKNPNLITLVAESVTAETSLALLNEYIFFVNAKVTDELMHDLKSTLQIKSNELTQQLESRRDLVAQQLRIEVAKAELAYRIANAAEIRKPVQNLNKKEVFAIDLGADALGEKVKVLKTLEDLSILDPNIAQLSNKLGALNRGLPKVDNLTLFTYLEEGELPLSRDKPKRKWIVVLGILLGGMFGVAAVLVFRVTKLKE
ncbi:hypothetical protein BCT30_04690 [Enterovibrio norvegicus]|uniref:LPS O-antigen chain length determinant protein WzzB n=1 Tax=Enterovibrio norvegicus TaxID=188144 RepID=UPI000C84E054|nr:Wzz/FepE/Etk N-terminal domain-containing protein [Enterovibrio norvegicus]MCC4797859.1 hypothetical protein [Enterovibrio norvegicus]PMI33000.1 hypothetical protein BCU47_10660 [Enterovibrio norvegicus]PMI34890.1 hypothetical protein BCU46_03010 [Enterovibrio norvegicus]PMN45097.1 hypothetical protein BCT30_04690 [Enterovibrio norvegicus]TKF12479.1 hypothetical protein FCV66_16135 [Enterovibrio norvegicus]